ncbi:MAG: NADH-quinone oxidoreductase subunit L [Coriobacteriia bacterium]|nr:NADH-quinone oxidoreductase subunit L [Coriobacteriia bacterium]
MATLLDNLWLVVAFPAILALVVALAGRVIGAHVAWLSMLAPALVTLAGLAVLTSDVPAAGSAVEWLPGSATIGLGWAADGLTGVMLVVVGFVTLCVMLFSVGYMSGDHGIVRYYALLCLFTAAMSLLVIADGLIGLFVGWELVGASSYLLIGFWFAKPGAAAAAVKAFLTTRVGDIGLIFGIVLLWRETGALDYATVLPAAAGLAPEMATAAALLLAVGAIGKSAQFPLHIWLPDAMEGPTPVSALIHAATMVAAGVFLIARTWPLFEVSTVAQMVLLAVGAFTALAAATIAVAQRDIKKVLAYSTISQLGFMFAALGAGAWGVAIFHLVTHAAFKALLFLGSGSVIHGTGTQDLRQMGGLRRSMPVTAATWIVGSAALAGVFPLAGFFSKDEILHSVWAAAPLPGAMLFAASALTAFYITRATMLAFFGDYRGSGHPHEGGLSMSLPLLSLAVPAAFLGWFAAPLAGAIGSHAEEIHLATALVSTLIALVGISAGIALFRGGVSADEALERKAGSVWVTLGNAYRFDALVNATVVRPVIAISDAIYTFVDRTLIDGAAEGAGKLARTTGSAFSKLQSGDMQWYASLAVTGFIVLFVVSVMWERITALFGAGG